MKNTFKFPTVPVPAFTWMEVLVVLVNVTDLTSGNESSAAEPGSIVPKSRTDGWMDVHNPGAGVGVGVDVVVAVGVGVTVEVGVLVRIAVGVDVVIGVAVGVAVGVGVTGQGEGAGPILVSG